MIWMKVASDTMLVRYVYDNTHFSKPYDTIPTMHHKGLFGAHPLAQYEA
jgi:hypothetical protein